MAIGPTGTTGPTEMTGPTETMGPTGGAPAAASAPLYMIKPTAKVMISRSNGKGHHYHGVPKHGQNANSNYDISLIKK